MADTIVFRQPTKDDFAQIDQIIGKSFSIQQYLEKPEWLPAMQHAYVLESKRKARYQCVAVENGQVIGLIIASAKNDPPPEDILVSPDDPLAGEIETLMQEPSIQALLETLDVFKDYLQQHAEEFDGTLALFAVTDASRGKGVGKALLENVHQYWKKQGVKRIYLYTDETCNYGFYEHLGFDRLDTKKVDVQINGQTTPLTFYLYGYNVP